MTHPAAGRRVIRTSGTATLGVVALLISGCVQTGPIPRAPEGNPIDAARSLSDAPHVVRTNNAAKSCGVFVLSQGATVPASAVDCLKAAASNRDAAELAWSLPTSEGDPIVSFAFVAANSGDVTVYSTNAFDSYGGDPRWTRNSCNDPAIATSPAGCPAP